jgi:hypothetical protein
MALRVQNPYLGFANRSSSGEQPGACLSILRSFSYLALQQDRRVHQVYPHRCIDASLGDGEDIFRHGVAG